ncbi:hypothetical protein DPMN_065690 [Dreissena polymorpha]|uniref:Myb/SANT-like DNA-binding domain-containing protein n=1 Tax=Dreissena polymorpha TaxID=45954 RepID=A0A9D3YS39_DREPO|nr:hypothetical protein DPMN_065690 [Dreissena polymorpha]
MDSAKRAKAFSEREIDVITDFMKTNIHKLRANHGSGGPGMVARVRDIWSELLAGVNACGNGSRSLQQVKEKWRNVVNIELAKNAKSEVSRERNHATGGGPPLLEMSQTSQAVASLFATSASFHGIVEDADTVIAVTPPSPNFQGLPMMDFLTDMDIPDPFGVAETGEDTTSVPSASTASDRSRKRTLKDAQLEALESQAEMSRAGQNVLGKWPVLQTFLLPK